MCEVGGAKIRPQVLMNAEQILAAVVGAELLFCGVSSVAGKGFSAVATDSRNVVPGSLFVPLMGEFQDGHVYIPDAVRAGASVVFVDRKHAVADRRLLGEIHGDRGTLFFAVDDTLSALQDAAAYYVSLFPALLKVAVTGSSGKTTVKEMLSAVFSQRFKTVKNEGNLNSETGLPLSVFNIRPEHEAGVFELGMNRKNEIAETARVLRPRFAIITNIGSAHVGILGSRRAIAEEKKNIFSCFDESCAGFVPAADDFASFLADVPAGKVFFYGDVSHGDMSLCDGECPRGSGDPRLLDSGVTETEDLGLRGSRIRYCGLDIFLRIPGAVNLKNAVGAITLARYAGFSAGEIKAGLESVSSLPGRMEILSVSDGARRLTVIKDCYNANPDSMVYAVDFCAHVPRTGRLVLVLGSMLELGAESSAAHICAVRRALASGASAVFLFGGEMVSAWKEMQKDGFGSGRDGTFPAVFIPETIEELSAELSAFLHDEDVVLLKASRGMALERVLPVLAKSEGVPEASGV